MQAVYAITMLLSALLWFAELALFIRAVLSWIPSLDRSRFGDIVYAITEPILAPIRALLDRFSWAQNSPIDLSFLAAVILLMLLQSMLSSVVGGMF